MLLQRTLKKEVRVSGVGLHSGKDATVVLKPARPGTGIVFTRTDLKDSPDILASYENVVCTKLATTLGVGKVTVSTVEHLLAALHGASIDNLFVEVDGPELPVLDGSSSKYCEVIQKVGVESQLLLSSVLAIRQKVELKLQDKWAVVEPSNHFEVQASIEWDHPAIGFQEFRYQEGKTNFCDEIASARTFGFLHEVETLKQMGLARGGSLDNAIVLDGAKVLNPEGLRYSDEFVRHKVLDALGDLKLAGFPIQGKFKLHRPGHELHYQLVKEIFSDSRNYEIISPQKEPSQVPDRVVAALARQAAAY